MYYTKCNDIDPTYISKWTKIYLMY